MIEKHQIPFNMKYTFIIFFLLLVIQVKAQQVELTPTIHSMGVKITNISNADSCSIEYKNSNQSQWLHGFKPDKITISGTEQFRGSLFLLDEGTAYDVRVTIYQGINSNVLPVMQQSTNTSPVFSQTSNVKWVSPNGSGTQYSQSNPGNLITLFSSGLISCGTTILLTDGNYSISNGLSLTINNHCTENTPIVIIAAPNAHPVINGGQIITSTWNLHNSIPNLYTTTIPSGSEHSNICVMGDKALYPYPSITPEILLGGYNLAALDFDYDGFVRDQNSISIKTQSGMNPNNETVVVSKALHFLTVYGNNKNAFLKIKGINFKYFGKPVLNPLGSSDDSYSASVFDLRNINHVYFDSCKFEFNNSDISFSNECNQYTIQNCLFKHDVGKWSHAMIKKSLFYVHSIFNTISSSRGRTVETSAIFVPLSKQGVIRSNYFDGLNSGVVGNFESGFNEEIDIYDNVFIDNFDAIECDGLWCNLRAWNNEIIRPMSGISAAPPLIGPRYFYRNVFHGMKGRINEQDDPYFIGCHPVGTDYKGQGIGIKTNSGYQGNLPPGNLYFFNNTFHSYDTLGFVFTSWKSEWKQALFINNSYTHQISHPFYYFNLGNSTENSNFQLSSHHDNYYSYNSSSPIVVAKHIHGQFNCTDINDVNSLQNQLRSISGSSNIEINSPMQNNPLFNSNGIGGFQLLKNSALIDAGIKIKGFYDFQGNNPDIGAKESNYPLSISNILSLNDATIFPNPTCDILKIEFKNNSSFACKIHDAMGQLVYTTEFKGDTSNTIDMRSINPGIYLLEININGIKSTYKIIKL